MSDHILLMSNDALSQFQGCTMQQPAYTCCVHQMEQYQDLMTTTTDMYIYCSCTSVLSMLLMHYLFVMDKFLFCCSVYYFTVCGVQ